jgi:hypothetical protein
MRVGKRLRNDVCGPRFVHFLPHRADWIAHDCAETTAYALAATIGFLGLHSEIQEDLYQEVMEVVGRDSDPVGHKVSRLFCVMTCRCLRLLNISLNLKRWPMLSTKPSGFSVGLFFALWSKHYSERTSDSGWLHNDSGGHRGHDPQGSKC